jgi:Methyl-CpG binding domain
LEVAVKTVITAMKKRQNEVKRKKLVGKSSNKKHQYTSRANKSCINPSKTVRSTVMKAPKEIQTSKATNIVNSTSTTMSKSKSTSSTKKQFKPRSIDDDSTPTLSKSKSTSSTKRQSKSRLIRDDSTTTLSKSKSTSSTKKQAKLNNSTEVYSGPPTEPLEGGWPSGWTKQVVQRQSGASAGSTDRYWYSPITGKKFRSMVGIKRFLSYLDQCQGDEDAAWNLMK